MSVNQTFGWCGVESAGRPITQRTFGCFGVRRVREPAAPRPKRLS
ncbi:MAG TPA: hypothetical protein VMJ31_04555 [Methylocystis sp.]|nr:hypothetical protein [Methylocystis sp.]